MKTRYFFYSLFGNKPCKAFSYTTYQIKEYSAWKTENIVSEWLIAIIALAIIGCKQDEPADTPREQPDTPRALSFGTNCKVTISSADTFTNDEWNTLCNSVVSAIEARYNTTGAQANFTDVFAPAKNSKIVLGNNFTHNWETKSDESDTAYIKTASISTVDIDAIVLRMKSNAPGNG